MRFDNAPNTIARKQTPRPLTSEDTHSLVKLGLFIAALLFMATLFGLMTWDQLDKSRGMTFGGQLKGAFACASVGLLLVVAGVPFLMWRSGRGVLRDVLFTVEEVTGKDLNRDGVVGTNVLVQTDERQWMAGRYAISPELLFEWARVALDGGRLSYSRWEKEWPGNREGYARFRDTLISEGRLKKTPSGQVSLTDSGRKYFGQLARMTETDVTPLPHSQGYPQLPSHTRT